MRRTLSLEPRGAADPRARAPSAHAPWRRFADTYQRVKDNSEREFVYLKYMRLFEYRNVLLRLPPVLNAPFVLYELLKSARHSCRKNRLSDRHTQLVGSVRRGWQQLTNLRQRKSRSASMIRSQESWKLQVLRSHPISPDLRLISP